jgi:glycosyltransferase involved in cell wall biosynthesis
MIAFYGLDGNIIEHKGIKTFPKISDIWGLDAMIHHGKDWGSDITISMQDIWVLDQQGIPLIPRWIPMVFVDHDPMPDSTYHRLKQAYRIITVSKFGQRELEKKGLASTYIPMTIDMDVFKPRDKKEMRKLFGIPEDIFLFGMIGANKENPPRKSFQEAMDAFKLFLDKHPNSGLYFHSYLQQPGGFPIEEYAKYIKINHAIYHRDQYKMMFKSDDEVMAKLMSCFDVLLQPSVSEGFGVPVIEAQACGVPVIVNRFASLPELVIEGVTGEICEVAYKRFSPLISYVGVPDYMDLYAKMEKLYSADREKMGKEGRKWVNQYNSKHVMQNIWIPFLENVQKEIYPNS